MDITYVIFNSDEISDPLSQTNRRWERGQRRGFRIGFLVIWLHRFPIGVDGTDTGRGLASVGCMSFVSTLREEILEMGWRTERLEKSRGSEERKRGREVRGERRRVI